MRSVVCGVVFACQTGFAMRRAVQERRDSKPRQLAASEIETERNKQKTSYLRYNKYLSPHRRHRCAPRTRANSEWQYKIFWR